MIIVKLNFNILLIYDVLSILLKDTNENIIARGVFLEAYAETSELSLQVYFFAEL